MLSLTKTSAYKNYFQWHQFLSEKSSNHFLDGPPILITGPQRCGTTWFGQMLQTKGVQLYHEPLGQYGILWNPKIASTYQSGIDTRGLRKKIHDINKGIEWKTFNYRPPSSKFRSASKTSPARFFKNSGRVIIKDPTCVGMLNEISCVQRFKKLILVRHPCGHAASLKRLSWEPSQRLQFLLNHPRYKNMYGDAQQNLESITQHLKTFTLIELISIQYCLLLRLALQTTSKCTDTSIFVYDDLAAAPVREFKKIFAALDLPYSQETTLYHEFLACGKKDFSSSERHDTKRNSSYAANRWRAELDKAEIEKIKKIWLSIGPKEFVNKFEFSKKHTQ